MRDANCIRRRLLTLARQCYLDQVPAGFSDVNWRPNAHVDAGGRQVIDRALVGTLDWAPAASGKAIVIAFRGTLDPRGVGGPATIETLLDWLNNTEASLSPFDDDPAIRTGRVHKGFKESLEHLWPGIKNKVEALIAGQAHPHIFITGHSKGGALAVLAAMRASAKWPDAHIRVVTFAAARAGDAKFRAAYRTRANIRTDQYEVRLDPVPHLPPSSEDSPAIQRVTRSVLALLDRAGVEVDDIPNFVSVGEARIGGKDVVSSLIGVVSGLFGGLFGGGPPKLNISAFLLAHQIADHTEYDDLLCSATDVDRCDHS
jgi:hypothetical protein